jgi:2,3-bisphosphoglycerate-independent phosphoglycerate mutase
MNSRPDHILLLFLDGVGIGDDDPATNPFASASLPVFRTLLGGELPLRSALGPHGRIDGDGAILVAADATLGVPGRPQSGTGQTALLTGANAPAIFGRHFGSWVPTALRELLGRDSLLNRAVRAGRSVAFANAYPAASIVRGGLGRRPAALPLAALAAGVLNRDVQALRDGRAVASSITNERWRQHLGDQVPDVSPEAAGRTLAAVAAEAEVTLFAHYDMDIIGHRSGLPAAVSALERVDAFLGGVLASLAPNALLVIASDHGNIEDVTGGHTLNPVPVIAVGAGFTAVAERVRAITDVAPTLCTLLNIPSQ